MREHKFSLRALLSSSLHALQAYDEGALLSTAFALIISIEIELTVVYLFFKFVILSWEMEANL